jgi:hypothetical protein
MALIGNYSILLKSPGRWLGGPTMSGERSNWSGTGESNNRFISQNPFLRFESTPRGYRPPYTWQLPVQGGGLACTVECSGGVSSANLAGGKNATADLAGTGGISSAPLQLIASLVATITAAGGLQDPVIAGILQAVATLTGTGATSTPSLSAKAGLSASIAGTSASSLSISGKGNISANITPFTELSPQSLAAEILDKSSVESNLTVREALRLLSAVLAGEVSGGGTTTITFRSTDDTKDRVVATVDSNGNRTAITYDKS